MSNPSQRAKIARVPLHEPNPIVRAIAHRWGVLSVRVVIAEVLMVDGKLAADRLAIVPLHPDPIEGVRLKRIAKDQEWQDTLDRAEFAVVGYAGPHSRQLVLNELATATGA